MTGIIKEESFANVLFLDGKGTICCQNETLEFQKGDSFFISAGSGEYEICGVCEALITTVK